MQRAKGARLVLFEMMQLPESTDVDVSRLSAIFKHTTLAYKFYWFLAILNAVKNDREGVISYDDIALRMFATVWYPLDFYKLSFGPKDGFERIRSYVLEHAKIDNTRNAPHIFSQLSKQLSDKEMRIINDMTKKELIRYVPYHFLTPFLEGLIEKEPKYSRIAEVTNQCFNTHPQQVIYRIINESIELNPKWVEYLRKHLYILEGFTKWHLVQFLQKNNPNVAAVSEKLAKSVAERDFKQAKPFWKKYLVSHPELTCIYSGQSITVKNISLDHYIPFSYVAHDQIWNLIPTIAAVNSAKNNRLPDKNLYFDRYAKIQFDVFQFYATATEHDDQKRLLLDYTILFRESTDTIQQGDFLWFREQLRLAIEPQLQTACNMGFTANFIYKNALKQ